MQAPLIDIRKFRKERKLTQVVFDKQLGYTHAYISNIEKGKEPITDNFLDKLHEAFGIDVEPYKSYNQKVTPESELNDISDKEYLAKLRLELEDMTRKYIEQIEKHNRCMEEKEALYRRLVAQTDPGRQ